MPANVRLVLHDLVALPATYLYLVSLSAGSVDFAVDLDMVELEEDFQIHQTMHYSLAAVEFDRTQTDCRNHLLRHDSVGADQKTAAMAEYMAVGVADTAVVAVVAGHCNIFAVNDLVMVAECCCEWQKSLPMDCGPFFDGTFSGECSMVLREMSWSRVFGLFQCDCQ